MIQTKEKASLELGFIRQLEQIEVSYWMRYYKAGGVYPAYSSVIGGGAVCAIPDLDILAMNRAIGLGIETPVNRDILWQIIQFYQQAGSSRFFIQLPPGVVLEETRELLTATGFAHHNNWTKLFRKVQPMEFATNEEQFYQQAGSSRFFIQLPPGVVLEETRELLTATGFAHHNNWTKLFRKVQPMEFATNEELSIRKIDRSESDNYGQLIFMSFDWEDSRLASWLASTVGQDGYHHYIVSWKGRDIAAGALFVEGEMASMAFAGTLAAFRGKGAQSLLLKTRMRDAQRLGARFITAETGDHTPERPVKSYLNMIRSGFQTAYQRQNWIFRFG